jgi:hypothetical protein
LLRAGRRGELPPFTTGDELSPNRIIRWRVYVRITNSENVVSQSSPEQAVVRD